MCKVLHKGKTRLSTALAVKACGLRLKVVYTTMSALVARLEKDQAMVTDRGFRCSG
ncbi:MAG TPA: hypothetical protein PK344_17380 [Syntrophorhabdaceae bacterium]|nr:hypothetical protein [Syntrophorhabdaceae bacterium]